MGGLGAAGLSILGAVTYGGLEAQPGEKSKDSYYQQRFQTWMKLAREGRLSQDAYAEIAPHLTDAQRQALTKAMGGGGSTSADRLKGGRGGRPASAGPGGGTRRRDQGPTRSRTEADIQLDIARASTTAGTADDLQYERELRGLYARQIHSLESRKHLSDQQKQKLTALYQSLAGVQSNIDSIVSAGEDKIAKQRKDAQEKRAKRREAAAKRFKDADTFYRKRLSAALGAGPVETVTDRGSSLSPKQIAKIRNQAKTAAKTGGLTEAQVRAMEFDFLGSLKGVLDQYGGNLLFPSPGVPDPHVFQQTHSLHRIDRHLATLSRGLWQPQTAYVRGELGAAGYGTGF